MQEFNTLGVSMRPYAQPALHLSNRRIDNSTKGSQCALTRNQPCTTVDLTWTAGQLV